jgi:hypothetical protein
LWKKQNNTSFDAWFQRILHSLYLMW